MVGALACTGAASSGRDDSAPARFSVLVFSKTDTAGVRHTSIPDGIEAIRRLGAQYYFEVDTTEDAAVFTSDSLDRYGAVVFLSTSGNVLHDAEQRAFENYIRSGGGFVGIHGAAATEYDWPWYGGLVGAFFDDHPQIQEARINVVNSVHPSTLFLPRPWTRTDEWYNFRTNPADSVQVLLDLDEGSYEGGTMGASHPIAWMRAYDGGRSFYTALGHTPESFSDPLFLRHVLKGLEWSAGRLDGFVEPDFPFITTAVDAGGTAPFVPERNMAVRGIALQLGNGAYACFDPDLLRMAVGWTGEFLSLSTMAQVSYQEPFNKQNDIPRVLGRPVFGTGIYPGWMGDEPNFTDPRPPGPNPDDPGRGPIAAESGRWNGLYVVADAVVLSYTVDGTDILEQPGSVVAENEVGISRTFDLDSVELPLTLVVAEIGTGSEADVTDGFVAVDHGVPSDSVTAVGVVDIPEGAQLSVHENRYVTLHLAGGTPATRFKVVVWTGLRSNLGIFEEMLRGPVHIADVEDGGPSHWPETVHTRGELAPDTSAFVSDRLSLPLPNPWNRNVRVADVDFFPDGRAALVTFSGDVWLLSNIDHDLDQLRWKRFASGLYEPLSLSIVSGEIFVFGREGIVRLIDLNGDREADFYENFSNLIIQTSETRDWAMDMVPVPAGGFFVAKGATLDAGPRAETSRGATEGFRVGSRHAGTVMYVSPDGRGIEVFADGFRQPFLGLNPRGNGVLTVSDQQGNYVPATPIYVVEKGGYYGVPAAASGRERLPEPLPPLTWLPHSADPSGAGQVWVDSDRMGPLDGTVVHLSYGRPGPFVVYADTTQRPWQGGASPLPGDYVVPTMKGEVHPGDGRLYMAGFQVWGSRAAEISSLIRLRYTGQPAAHPIRGRSGQQGVLLGFDRALNREVATRESSYEVRRWNYRRTEQYGSGHFTLEGSPGEEELRVASAHLSEDGKSVLLVLPDMKPAMQMEVDYLLESSEGIGLSGPLYLTLHDVRPLDLEAEGFVDVDWQAEIARMPERPGDTLDSLQQPSDASPSRETEVVSAERGRHIYQEVGCVSCHSLDGTQAAGVGPTFEGLYGSERLLQSGATVIADETYLRESILDPAGRIVEGYVAEMPPYEGVLGPAEIESLILFITTLE